MWSGLELIAGPILFFFGIYTKCKMPQKYMDFSDVWPKVLHHIPVCLTWKSIQNLQVNKMKST